MSSSSSRQSPELLIRDLTAADLGEVSRLAEAAASVPDDNTYPIVMLDKELRGVAENAPPAKRTAFGAFEDARLVATGCSTPLGESVGWISRIYVDSALRRAGIAGRLVEFLEKHLKGRGCSCATLDFWGMRHTTQRFWLKMGYARTGTWAHPKFEGAFVVVCRKAL
jgi:GNAT superfamily N-acetyltransferase